MPNTKKCEKCGWEYHITYPEPSCRFCGTRFKKGFCAGCGKYTDIRYGRYCTQCYSKRQMAATTREQETAKWQRWYAKQLKQQEDRFNSWLSMIARVPQPLRTLTEDEWIAACLHFGKCAVCDNESIDARAFFVAFAFGGRYAAWNVIPVCEKCATALRRRHNPFIKYEEAAPKIVDYLRPILERTIANEEST